MSISNYNSKNIPTKETRIFAQKVARSIVEIQANVNNLADIVVLLEVLGYSKNTVMKYGFKDFYEFAKYLYGFIDVYDDADKSKEEFLKSFYTHIPDTKHRIVEGLSMIFPWLGSLILLFVFGISLWMAWGLPTTTTTAFVVGIFLGLVITEGILHTFNRLFTFYHTQKNLCEIKRVLKRNYILISFIIAAAVGSLYGIATIVHIPYNLVNISVISTVTIALHRTSYMVIYALKKIKHLIFGYCGAFATLLSVYYFLPNIIPEASTRYFVALGTAFVVLSILAVYHHYKIISKKSESSVTSDMPHFFRPISVTDKTIMSRFNIQLWETMPYFLFGTFYFCMLFADRILSWIFNPMANQIGLPMEFNSIYHTGADLALLVIFPTAIIQYVLTGPIYSQVGNMTITHKVFEMKKITTFLQQRYKLLLMISLISATTTAVIINFVAPVIVFHAGGSQISIQVFRIASISNIFLSIFAANSMFMAFLNRPKIMAIIAIIGTAIIAIAGTILAQSGFGNIVFSYLGATIMAAIASTLYARKIMKNAENILFSKYT